MATHFQYLQNVPTCHLRAFSICHVHIVVKVFMEVKINENLFQTESKVHIFSTWKNQSRSKGSGTLTSKHDDQNENQIFHTHNGKK